MFTGDLLESTLLRLEKRIIDKVSGVTRGISTGITKLDEHTGGLIGGRFYIIAARTSVGKTTFATFLALNAAKQNKNVLIFSNEMDAEDLVEKFISRVSSVNSKKIQTGDLSEDEQNRIFGAVKSLNDYKIGINQHYGWNLETLESEIYRCHASNKCDVVFVDYTQQVSVSKLRTKVEIVSEVATRLKKISRDLNIAVVGLAQINRDTEKFGQKPVIPGLANLKDSGALEQDADVVMILHKDDIAEKETVLRLAKNRMGETGIINLIHETSTNSYKQN
jgi:replicative DNA helicase